MSTSTHNIAIRGKDQTATAFQSIQARAIAAGNRISRVTGGGKRLTYGNDLPYPIPA